MTPAETIASALGGYRIARDEWRCKCPAHGDRDPSLDVRDGREGVLVVCRAGCSQDAVIDALKDLKLWPEGAYAKRTNVRPDVRHEINELEAQRMRAFALRIWDEALDPRYTLAEQYLVERGLMLPVTSCARFAPRCPRGRGAAAPALVVLMRNVVNNQPQAIQRIFINPKTLAKDKCEASPKGTMMLGPAEGTAMMLTDWHNTFWDCLSFCPRLFVCEGFETACALLQRGRVPIWALGDAGRIARLPVLFGVGELVICADHDKLNEKTGKRAGLAAAVECRARWNATSHQSAKILTVDTEGEDFADWGKHGQQAADSAAI